jgi:peptide chain release factor 3
MGKDFTGVIDLVTDEAVFFTKTAVGGAQKALIERVLFDSDLARAKIPKLEYERLLDELGLLQMAGNPFSKEAFLKGELTPVFFASALTNFGVEPFFDAFITLAPCPHAREATSWSGEEVIIDPIVEPFSGYVFKLQANMDKRHRDSMAFIRICSGKLDRDLVVKNHRLKKDIRLSRPHGMVAGERTTLDDAYPGDVIGVINPGAFSIGDTLSINGGFDFKPLPQFQPEIFARIYPKDVDKRKAFDKGTKQLVEEGAIQRLQILGREGELIFAACGQLQFEVMQYRLKDEYHVDTVFNILPYNCSAWILGDIKTFQKSSNAVIVEDKNLRPMVLFDSQWSKQYSIKQNPNHQLVDVVL